MDHRVDNSGVAMALGGLIPASPDNVYCGSRNPCIQALVIEINDLCIQANINRSNFWVPRSLNQIADYLNKVSTGDHYSYMLRTEVFAHLQTTFGPHAIDRFASRNNVQVYPPKYFSKFFEPEAEGIDAFSCHWKYNEQGELENNWLHPPYAMIGAAVRHLLACEAQATLIAPRWIAAPWWPNLAACRTRGHLCMVLAGKAYLSLRTSCVPSSQRDWSKILQCLSISYWKLRHFKTLMTGNDLLMISSTFWSISWQSLKIIKICFLGRLDPNHWFFVQFVLKSM